MLPAPPSHPADLTAAKSTATQGSPARNVLMVDDNPGDIALFRQVMEEVKGIGVHVAHNVLQAHAFLGRMPPFTTAPVPDLMFLDLHMPMLSGHNVIPLVRRDARFDRMKVVMFTSSSLTSDRLQCHALGADDYVVKPCDWDQWQTIIHRVLARHGLM